MKKLFSLILCVSMLLGIAFTMTSNVFADNKSGPAVDKDTVVIATANETPSLTTANHAAVAGDYMNQLTHSGLYRLDENLIPVLDLAESVEVEEDENGEETIWVFKLREDVKFSNGMDMTAEDFKASLDYAKEQPEVAAYTTSIDSVEVRDTYTLAISTGEKPSAILPYELATHANYVVPKALLDEGHDFNVDPVGTGPYKLVEWKKSEQLEFTANEYYYGGKPAITNVIVKIIPEGVNRTIAMQAGDVDYIIDFDSASVATVKDDENIVVWNEPSITHTWLGINDTKEPFDDPNFRKFLNVAINKEDVIEVSLDGFASPAVAQVPTGMGDYEITEGYDAEYDPDKAQEYLDAWGGDPSSVTLDIICSNDAKRRAAEVIQAYLAEYGVNVTITSMDLATYLSETAALNHDGFIGGYTTTAMPVWLKGVFHTANVGGSNKTGLSDPELDEMIDNLAMTIDEEKSHELVKEIATYINELCPQVPLYQDNNISAYKAGLENVFISAAGEIHVQDWSWAE